jgi:hypothetical protein
MLITSNQSFGEWGKVFPDQAMTLAAIDRLVHHAERFGEFFGESGTRRVGINRKKQPNRVQSMKFSQAKRRRRRGRLNTSRIIFVLLPAYEGAHRDRRRFRR